MKALEFTVKPSDLEKIDTWLHSTVYPPILVEQLEDPDVSQFIVEDERGRLYPYTGAIGGELTFTFTPTSLGDVFKVKHYSGLELNLTDYDSW